MLKVHSFLQGIKEPIHQMIDKLPKCRGRMATISYTMVTVLFLLSPDYLYGGKSNIVEAANVETKFKTIELKEETANEAIVLTDYLQESNKKNGVMYSLNNNDSDDSKIYQEFYNDLNNNISFDFDNILKENEQDNKLEGTNTIKVTRITLDKLRANFNNVEAAAGLVDSSSTNENKVPSEQTLQELTMEESIAKAAIARAAITEVTTAETTTTETKAEVTTAENNKSTQAKLESSQTETKKETKAAKHKSDSTKEKKTKESKTVIDLSNKEIKILQRIVEAEATGEDVKGKILVANVILNRIKSGSFPDSVEAVVFQKNQFSPIQDGRYWSVDVTKSTRKAVERALQGEDYSKGALFFSARDKADKSSMNWFDNHLDYLFQYGGHEFFR